MINRKVSIPVNEAEVDRAIAVLRSQPGGVVNASEAMLNQLGQTMAARDFEALKMDVADVKWLAENAERLEELKEEPFVWGRFRGMT